MRALRGLTRERLLSMPIASSPNLRPIEKETCLNVLGGEKVLTVMSRHPTGVRGFLRQPEFAPTAAFVETIRGRETLVGVDGDLPLACLHIGAPRKRQFLSYVFARRSRSTKDRIRAPQAQGEGLKRAASDVSHSEQATDAPMDSTPSDCVRGRQ